MIMYILFLHRTALFLPYQALIGGSRSIAHSVLLLALQQLRVATVLLGVDGPLQFLCTKLATTYKFARGINGEAGETQHVRVGKPALLGMSRVASPS